MALENAWVLRDIPLAINVIELFKIKTHEEDMIQEYTMIFNTEGM